MNEKILLVTGASSDIGSNLIKEVADNYDFIIAHHNNDSEALEKLKQNMKDKLILLKGNFMDLDDTYEFVQKIKDINKIPTDIVHLPAGRIENKKFSKLSWNDFEKDLNIAFRSIVIILNEFLPIMAKNKYGKIVVMLTSCTTNMPPSYLASYVSAKYALLGLVKSLAREYSSKGVRINGISPSMIETKFLEKLPDLVVKQNANNSPTGQNLSVLDVVPTLKFLLSEGAGAITGENIAITNGNI